jgi:putative tryptophan/tyrosine transport system substrate-binding protein
VVRELAPSDTVIAVLVNPGDPIAMPDTRDMEKVAGVLGRQVYVLSVSTDSDFDRAFATLVERRIGALIVGNDVFLNSRRKQIVALAARHAVPTVYPWRTFVEAGGLISYGASLTDAYRQEGVYTGRILKGEKPADLPILQPTKFELVINLKVAKTLGLTIPPALLARADEVIK